MITVTKDNYQFGQISVGMTRIDGQKISGFGSLGSLRLKVKENILQGRQSVNLIMGIGVVNFIDNQENAVSYNTIPSFITILADPNSTEYLNDNFVTLFPNPANSSLTIKSEVDDIIDLSIYSISGIQMLKQSDLNTNLINLDLNDFNQGIYIAKVITSNGIILRKFSVYNN
jgi:hypothetical protein